VEGWDTVDTRNVINNIFPEFDMQKKDTAVSAFTKDKYNCAQSVFLPFAEEMGLNRDAALKIACGFGGGIAHQQEVCGAVSGAVMAIGLRFGRSSPESREKTEDTYHKTAAFMHEFTAKYGSVSCGKLLSGLRLDNPADVDIFIRDDLRNRVCAKCVAGAVEIAEAIMQE
jgi:C_GCAxxG_C_C family probable redox protein